MLAVVADNPDPAIAKSNREAIEQGLANGGTANLPAGLISVDRAVRLPSGCTLAGVVQKTVIRNTQTGTPFTSGCTLIIHSDFNEPGIGYADDFTPGKAKASVVLADASKCAVGSWLFAYKWDGYLTGNPQTTVHQVQAKSGNTLKLNSAPQSGSNKVAYATRAVRVSAALEGNAKVKVAAGSLAGFAPGKLVLVTAGPSVGNECVGEVRRLIAVASDALTFDRPLRSSYPYQLSLAVLLTATENVTIRDLSIESFNGQCPPIFCQYAVGLAMQRVASAGQIDLVQCFDARLYDCTGASSLKLNATRDALVSGGRCQNVFIEEACADVEFANLLVSGSSTAGVNAVAGSPSERITIRDCVVERCADMPIHLVGRECVVDGCIVRNSANPVSWVNSYIGGDGTRVTNLRSDLPVVFTSGRGLSISSVPSSVVLGWVEPGNQPTGVTVACPTVDTSHLSPATLAQWTIAPAAS